MPPRPLPIIRKDDVQVENPLHIPTPAESIGFHWQELNGAPGQAISALESVPGGFRIRYENGVIYDWRDATAWVYGDDRYSATKTVGGAHESWLGLPLADEAAVRRRRPSQPVPARRRLLVAGRRCHRDQRGHRPLHRPDLLRRDKRRPVPLGLG